MGIDELRIAVTILSFVAFIAIMVWAWSKRNKAAFDEAANLPFTNETEGTKP
jgi:cytochrome c oxidase cbb3-type subunit 4